MNKYKHLPWEFRFDLTTYSKDDLEIIRNTVMLCADPFEEAMKPLAVSTDGSADHFCKIGMTIAMSIFSTFVDSIHSKIDMAYDEKIAAMRKVTDALLADYTAIVEKDRLKAG